MPLPRELLTWAACLLLALPARAEPEEAPYRPITSGPFVSFAAPLPAPGRLVTQPIFSFAGARGNYGLEGRYQSLPPGESRSTAALSLYLEYGLIERLSAGAQVTLQHHRRRLGPDEAFVTGLGETLVFGRGTLLRETAGGLPEVALLAQVKLPTSWVMSRRDGPLSTGVLGTGSTDLTLGLNFTKGVRPVLLHADVLYTHALPARIDGVRVAYGRAFSWSLAGEWPFWRERLGLMLELSGRHQEAPSRNRIEQEDALSDEVRLGAGLELLFSADLQLLVGYQRTPWGRNTRALDVFLVTLVPTLF